MSTAAVLALALVAVVVVVVVGVLAARGKFGGLVVKAGPVSVDWRAVQEMAETVAKVAEGVDEINASVNGVAPGEPKLRQTVETMATTVGHLARVSDWQCQSIHTLAGASGVSLPPEPREGD